jgi:hypothetical protein
VRKFFEQNKYVFYLLIISVLACFGTLIFAPIYDFADEFFPSRWFMMNTLENGVWPFWCPYRSMGIPAHADPQSSIFYLPFWLLALVGHYNSYFWSVEFIFHVFMAGWGFYKLAQCFSKREVVCFLIACCYMLSGPFTGNTQHYSWIIALAWLPWALNYMLRIFETPSLKNAMCFALALSLMFTGGYSGFCFILFYFFIVFAIAHIISMIAHKEFGRFKRVCLFLGVSAVALVLLSLPSMLSYMEAMNYVTRGDGLTYEQATAMAYTPKALLSMFFPWMASYSREWMSLDISMRSVFVGLFTVFFFMVGLFQRKNVNVWLFLCWGILCLLWSFGSQLPIYKIAYHLPFINMLRYQTIFRCFVVVSILVVATLGCEALWTNFDRYKKFFMVFILLLGAMYLAVVVYHVSMNWSQWQKNSTNSIHWILQSLFYLVLMLVVAFLLWRKKQDAQPILATALLMDLVVMAWLCLSSTGFQKNYTNAQFAEILATVPHDYPLPQEVTSCERMQHEQDYGFMWQNIGCFAKKIEWASRDPFKLKTHQEMIQMYIEDDKLLYLPRAVFFPSEIVYSDEPQWLSVDTAYTSKITAKSRGDNALTTHYETEAKAEFVEFKPGEALLQTFTTESRPMVLAQMWYPGWKAEMDNGIPLQINVMNKAMMSVDVPEGKHQIRFYYDRRDCKIAFVIQCVVAVLAFILILFNRKKTA